MSKSSASDGTKPSFFERVSYGSGDFGFNFYWAAITSFLAYFYTDSFGLLPAAAAGMLLLTKTVSAVTDPIMASIADRTKTRWGRFRPWLVWASLPLAIAGVLTFTTPDLDDQGKLIYAYCTFSLLMVTYAAVNIPYGALSAVLTSDPNARTQINSFRFVGGFLGGTFVTYMTPKLVEWLGQGNDTLGWQLTLALYGACACLIFLNLFAQARERVVPVSEQKTNPLTDIKDLANNGPWVVLFFLALVIMLTIAVRSGAGAYYIKYYVGRPDLMGSFLATYGAALAFGALITPLLAKFLDKRNLMILMLGLTGVLSLAFVFVQKDQITLMYGFQVALGLCLGPKSPLTYAMYGDCADYNEFKTGRRATAMTFAAASFSQKLGGALASAVILSVLAWLGYKANEVQSSASLDGIVWLMSVVPGIFALLAAGLMFFYKLNDAKLVEVQATLAERRSNTPG